ncbi:hypothetical protein D3C74_208200 [compost metagenome]
MHSSISPSRVAAYLTSPNVSHGRFPVLLPPVGVRRSLSAPVGCAGAHQVVSALDLSVYIFRHHIQPKCPPHTLHLYTICRELYIRLGESDRSFSPNKIGRRISPTFVRHSCPVVSSLKFSMIQIYQVKSDVIHHHFIFFSLFFLRNKKLLLSIQLCIIVLHILHWIMFNYHFNFSVF